MSLKLNFLETWQVMKLRNQKVLRYTIQSHHGGNTIYNRIMAATLYNLTMAATRQDNFRVANTATKAPIDT